MLATLGVEVNFQTGSVRLNLGHSTIGLNPNFEDKGFSRQNARLPSLFQVSREKLEQIDDELWMEFDIEDYRRIRPLLPIPYLVDLGDIPPVIILDKEPKIWHTREPYALGFTNFRAALTKTNLLPLVTTSTALRGRLRELVRLPRERPLIMVLTDTETLPLHGKYLRHITRPSEMTPLHELSLLKFWSKKVYETITFGDITDLAEVIRLEGPVYSGKEYK